MVQDNAFQCDKSLIIKELGKERLLECLNRMLMIRNFEIRAESAYQHGHIGGFFHSYIGQEAIQVAALEVFGQDNWWAGSYRCHALALTLGVTAREAMAELYGKVTGNAMGRGGSMHLFSNRLLGGFGIVGGQVPIATGAAFSLKYIEQKEKIALCFLGDGAVAQGSVHESLNLASLWSLPCLYIVENNQWGMGTAKSRAISMKQIAKQLAPSYNMEGYALDGMDFFNCLAGFTHIRNQMRATSRPVLVEAVTERFRGHSISDPGLYRTKEALKECMERDPILLLKNALEEAGFLDEETYKEMDKRQKEIMIDAMEFAEKSPWPDTHTLEEDVFAP